MSRNKGTRPDLRVDVALRTVQARHVMRKMVHRSAAAALLAPMVLFAISAWGLVGLRCRITGLVSFATCCPSAAGEAGDASPAAPDSVDEPGCCERVVVDNTRPPVAGVSVVRESVAPLPVALLPAAVYALPIPRVVAIVAGADPPRPARLSLCVLNRSLLI